VGVIYSESKNKKRWFESNYLVEEPVNPYRLIASLACDVRNCPDLFN
jgi:hypothetical protein